VTALRAEHGTNELAKEEKTPLWKLILEQFDDLLVKILLGAAMLSFVLAFFEEHGEEGIAAFVEPFVIILILIINAAIGVWQENNAENALERLKEMQSEHARVYRNGTFISDLPAAELVPGDICEIWVGDKVPADCRVAKLLTTTIRTEEAALTGESKTILKDSAIVPKEDVSIDAKCNMLFTGTSVTNGKARCIVVRTGMNTELGKIQAAVMAAKEDKEDEKTPLGQKIDDFGEMLTKVIAGICLLVWVMNFNQFWDPVHGSPFKGCIYYLKIAVALGVAAIPEGLPAVITLCLALGTRKMVKRNCIVRKLPSVETLGCVTVICSDKTGTLTTNEMTVVNLVTFGSSKNTLVSRNVTGHSYKPEGEVEGLNGKFGSDSAILNDFCRVASYCNDSKIEYKNGKYVRIGEPTEAAIRILVEKLGGKDGAKSAMNPQEDVCVHSTYWNSLVKKEATLEFSRDRKSMSVLCRPSNGPSTATSTPSKSRYPLRSEKAAAAESLDGSVNSLFAKGAPEGIIERCKSIKLGNGNVEPMTPAIKKSIEAQVNAMAKNALRCIAFAIKEDLGDLATYNGPSHPAHKKLTITDNFASIESDMTFIGLVGIVDPPRPMVKTSIENCRKAGIRVIMITGDNQVTAESIAVKIGMFKEGEDLTGKSYTGKQFMALSEEKQIEVLMSDDGCRVFSRAEPTDKQTLVKILRKQQEVVAMTGDGVNDAPALQQADIGIAMGIAGTEVAKEASAMILADDDFSTIVAAVEEGRSIYENMKAFIRYLISSNIGEVASIFLTSVMGFPEGLIPVQLLWVNLVTDGPPATALGFNPADPDVMKKKPRDKDESLISGWVFFRYLIIGVFVGVATVGIFAYWYMVDYSNDGHTTVTLHQLRNWGKCQTWDNFQVKNTLGMDFSQDPCTYFTEGKIKASTLSLTVLVVIEMFNALNALSEDNSLLVMPPWCNPYLLLAITCSIGVHFTILYVPFLAEIFAIVPLTVEDWILVLQFSFPVVIIDEVLKFVGRNFIVKPSRIVVRHQKED
jgi:Ca2+-transporting ATPase